MGLKEAWNALFSTPKKNNSDEASAVVASGEEKSTSDEEQALQLASDLFPAVNMADINIAQYKRIPFADIGVLGAAFAQLPASARTIVQSVETTIKGGQQLFVGVNPKGVQGFLRMGSNGTNGNIMRFNGHGAQQVIAGRLCFKPVNGIAGIETTSTVMPIDPTTMMIAVALIAIEKRFDDLQKSVDQIMQFLVRDKQATQRGNLNTLTEILSEYKLGNMDEKRCATLAVQVEAIHAEANKGILFWESSIKDLLAKPQGQLQELVNKVLSSMAEYQLAIYLFGFSFLLSVLLQDLYSAEQLDEIESKMTLHAERYRSLCEQCRRFLTEKQRADFIPAARDKLGGLLNQVGKAIEANPVFGKGQVDEWLIQQSESLSDMNRQDVAHLIESFAPLEEEKIQPFLDSIHTMNVIHNQPNGMLMDEESFYLLTTA